MAARISVGCIVVLTPDKNPVTGQDVPHARSGHCCVADSSSVYSLGGIYYDPLEILNLEDEENFNPVFQEVWCYNTSLNIWSKVKMEGTVPPLTASMSSILSGHVVFTFGGSGFPFGARSDNRVHTFNLKTQCWATLPLKGDLPHAKYGQAMALVHNQYLYVFGGCRKLPEGGLFVFDSDLHRMKLETYCWEKVKDPVMEAQKNRKRKEKKKSNNDDENDAVKKENEVEEEEEDNEMYPLRNGSYRHQVANDEDRLYVLGGGTLWREVFPFDKIHAFNYATSRWEILSSHRDGHCAEGFPSPRKYHTCVQKGDEVFITGGHDGFIVFDDIWKLTLHDLQWSKHPAKLPSTLFFHAAALTPAGCMYIFGGVCNIQNSKRTSMISRIWLYLPSLQEICWHYLVQWIPNIRSLTQEQLLLMGIPITFVERLHWDKGETGIVG